VGKTLLVHDSASVQGEKVDEMLHVTLIITGIGFLITQVLLFWFAYRYQESDKRKALYFPHNNTMEIVWTVVPAIALTILVVIGLRNWFSFTGEAPQNAMQVEVTGKQFGWIFRYAGDDGVFGKKYYKMIDDANNALGLNWRDSTALKIKDDPNSHDDIVLQQTMYIVKDKPVKLIIGSRDVVHDVGLSWFRLKMDAVPGTPTTLWFTPKYTTKEMMEKTGNPNFQYELSCDQMCGRGHFSMRGVIVVESEEEYMKYISTLEPEYFTVFPDKKPKPANSAADTTKQQAPITAAIASSVN